MANETEPNRPLILEWQEPVSGDDLLMLRRAAVIAAEHARQILEEQPHEAVDLVGLANFAKAFCATVDRALAHPTVSANDGKSRRKRATPRQKIKHVYGTNGLCTVEHEPGRVCGKPRERARRNATVEQSGQLPVASNENGKAES